VIGPLEPAVVVEAGDIVGLLPAQTPWMDALIVTASGDAVARSMWLGMVKDAGVAGFIGEGSKRPSGFMRAAGDILKAMGEHTLTYLDPIMSIALAGRVLATSTRPTLNLLPLLLLPLLLLLLIRLLLPLLILLLFLLLPLLLLLCLLILLLFLRLLLLFLFFLCTSV
jgi:hypothetical protein